MLKPQPRISAQGRLSAWRRKLTGRLKRARQAFLASGVGLVFNAARDRKAIRRLRVSRDKAKRTLTAQPRDIEAWRSLADAYFALGQYEKAIAASDRLLALRPDDRRLWAMRDRFLRALAKHVDEREIEAYSVLDPQNKIAWNIRAGYLLYKQHYGEASEASDNALAIDPNDIVAMRVGVHARFHSCDWRKRESDKALVARCLRAGKSIITPFNHRALSASEAELFLVAQRWADDYRLSGRPLWEGEIFRNPKIKIAYLSSDFREHPVGMLMAGCFEHHDKKRFDLTAISIGPDDGSELRRRIEGSFDRFVDAQNMRDEKIAQLIHALKIDILIDLNGYTNARRTDVLARRPAPIQVNYLGFPGTMAAPFMDYIIADPVVIPKENELHYKEKVVRLPHTYLPSDASQPAPAKAPGRAEAGLPETGFVFASFNRCYKIDPEVFDVWMRLLRDVDGSVLWLREPDSYVRKNLKLEAQARGVDPHRIVYAPHVSYPDQMARQQLAGLFLDTTPYNAHTTASEALWAGLPVVTYLGESFQGRVAASVLHAMGLPELVTSSLREYEDLARALAQNPERLAALKAKLRHNRALMPLFDTARFTRNLETAYVMMWERQQMNLPPENLDVVENPSSV